MTELKQSGEYIMDPHQWVERHADYLYSFAIARLHDPDQAKDLVQETFLAALENISSFERKSTERTWLTAILKHKIIDSYRKKSPVIPDRNGSSDSENLHTDFFDPTTGHWNPGHWPQVMGVEEHDPLQNQELAQILQRCMHKLPSLWLSVFTLKHIEEIATDAICNELNISPSNFWVLIHRAKLNLRACLQKNWL